MEQVESSVNPRIEGDCAPGLATPNLVQLDPQGDVILSVGNSDSNAPKRFLASSAVLSLASPVFARMFRSDFREAIEVRSGSRPSFSLEEDDSDAMETILSLLHHQNDKVPDEMVPETLAMLAIHCDKYDCGLALRPWISQWCSGSNLDTNSTAEDYGYMLLAAHLFQASSFSLISKKTIENLAPGFASTWDEQEMMRRRPEWLDDALASQTSRLLENVHGELQSAEGRLRTFEKGYTMTGLVCVYCGRTHPDTAKRCHPCSNIDLYAKMCTKEYRISEYFSILRRCGVWPSVEPFKTCSVSDIADRLSVAKIDHRHQCAAPSSCPLILELEGLAKRTSQILKKSKGIKKPA